MAKVQDEITLLKAENSKVLSYPSPLKLKLTANNQKFQNEFALMQAEMASLKTQNEKVVNVERNSHELQRIEQRFWH